MQGYAVILPNRYPGDDRMSFFSRVFRSKDPSKKSGRLNGLAVEPEKPAWTDAWLRTEVEPEEVVDLLLGCTGELKDRGSHIYLYT